MVDCGLTDSCIDAQFIRENGIKTQNLPVSIPVFNADGTGSAAGALEEYVEVGIAVGMHEEDVVKLAVTALGSANIYLGHDWLSKHNPEIDWETGDVKMTRCPPSCRQMQKKKNRALLKLIRVIDEEMEEEEEWVQVVKEGIEVEEEGEKII